MMAFYKIDQAQLQGTPAQGLDCWRCDNARGYQWAIVRHGIELHYSASYKSLSRLDRPPTYIPGTFASFVAAKQACETMLHRRMA